ncbi:hypothetical protein J1605_012318, partial [Eschrichtius robustus]
NPRRQEPARGPLKRRGHSGAAPPQADSAPGRTRDRRGPLGFPGGLQRHLPKATQRAAAKGAEPDLPAVGGAATAQGLPTARPARHGGGEGAPGAATQERALGKGGGCAPGAGPGRGPTSRLAARAAGRRATQPALTMKRPREPSGSDSESDGPIDVGHEGELSQMARPLSTPSPSQMQARKKRRGIIEKRRRDRINSSLSELRRLVPTAFEKQVCDIAECARGDAVRVADKVHFSRHLLSIGGSCLKCCDIIY